MTLLRLCINQVTRVRPARHTSAAMLRQASSRSERTPGNNRTPEQRASDPEFYDDSFHAAKKAWQQGKDKPSRPVGDVERIFWFVPAAITFGLGAWQLQRLEWKLDLIEKRKARSQGEAVVVPAAPATQTEWDAMEWQKVSVTGEFVHEQEVYLSPRWFKEDRDINGGISEVGLHVVTPFRLENGDCVLVNRGWVSKQFQDPTRRRKGQVEGTVTIEGIARAQDKPGSFTPDNSPARKDFHWLDTEAIRHVSGCGSVGQPLVVLDATTSLPGGPVGGQTPDKWSNNHMNYALTWFGLSAATAAMAIARLRR